MGFLIFGTSASLLFPALSLASVFLLSVRLWLLSRLMLVTGLGRIAEMIQEQRDI